MLRLGSALIAVLLLTTACATTPRTPAPSPLAIHPGVSDGDRTACRDLAQREAADLKGKSVAGAAAGGFFGTLSAIAHPAAIGLIAFAPILAVVSSVSTASENAKLRRAHHDHVLNACLASHVAEPTSSPTGSGLPH